MFNLENKIQTWKRRLQSNPAFEDGDIAELESHLREEIDRLCGKGLPANEAFTCATETVGNFDRIGSEMRKMSPRTVSPQTRGPVWNPVLWLHFIKLVLRRQIRYKGYSFLTLFGLALGLVCCIMIGRYLQYEWSYDRHHQNADRIYRLVDHNAEIPGPIGPALKRDLPAVEEVARLQVIGELMISREEQRFYVENGYYADSTLFEVFSLPLQEGDPAKALTRPGSVVLSRSLANRLFGPDETVLGKSIILDFTSRTDFTVTGVLEDLPPQSHFPISYLVSQSSDMGPRQYNWYFRQFLTYLLLRDGTNSEDVTKHMNDLFTRYAEAQKLDGMDYELQPLSEIHLYSKLDDEITANGNVIYVYAFGSIGIIILVLAGINFINLSTARAIHRAGEVGVRKTAGASRAELVRQFMGESVLISYLAMGLALCLVWAAAPWFNRMVGHPLEMIPIDQGWFLAAVVGTPLLFGILAGLYPALVQSSFQPARALTGTTSEGRIRNSLQRSLVVFQFVLTSFMILASLGIYRQISYLQNKDLGYEEEQLLVIPIRSPEMVRMRESIVTSFRQFPHILQASFSGNLPDGSDWGIPVLPEGVPEEEVPAVRILAVDYHFVKTYGIRLSAGREFLENRMSDRTSYVLNETAARAFGWKDPVGKTLTMPAIGRTDPGQVIGVVEDFHFRSLHERISPALLMIPPSDDWYGYITVRAETGRLDETIRFLDRFWSELDPVHPFVYSFLDESLGEQYLAERKAGELVAAMSLVSVLIAAIGLFGLVSYAFERKTKEIGIRKILGASPIDVVRFLTHDFIQLSAAGFLIAVPLGYLALSRWLENFAYKTNFGPFVLLYTGIAVLAVSTAALAYHSWHAATLNPVKSLRSK